MKKQHLSSTPSPVRPTLADQLEEHPIVQWFSKHGLTLLYVILGAILAFILLYRYFGGRERSIQDFYDAESNMKLLQQQPSDVQAVLSQMQTILSAYPELHPKYDGLIAQALLNERDVNQAKPFAQLAIERTQSENAPFYTNFAQTTLLIAEHQYDAALTQAKELKQKLLEQDSVQQKEMNLLFAYNLLRIGMLQQQLGAMEEAQKTWKEWGSYVEEGSNTHSEGFKSLSRAFSEGKLSLMDYMQHEPSETVKK